MASSSIFIGIHGNVFCLDRNTGQEIWSASLKSTNFVTLLVDGDLVIAACKGEVYGIEKATGKLLWHNEMRGQGFGLASIATDTGASNPVSSAEELRRQQAAAAAASSAATG